MAEGITIEIVDNPEIDHIVELYKDAGWWKNHYTTDFIPDMVKNSFCFAAAFDNNKLIGMGRAISDRVSEAYIQDVVVLSPYRKQGIGADIVSCILDFLHSNDIDWIALIGEPGTQSFYERLGFGLMKDYIPMHYKGQQKDNL